MTYPSLPPECLPWLRTAGAPAAAFITLWALAPGLASVLPLPPFEASAAAFLVSIVLFPFLAVLYHMGLTPLLRSGAKEERP